LTIYISQGSVATQLRRGGIFNKHVITHFPHSVTVKEFLKSVNISPRYGQMFGDVFFSDARCTLLTPSHYDVIYANAQGGNTGTFSMLFRKVLRSSPPT